MNVESFRELRGALECRHGAADGWSGESSEEEHSECYLVSLLKVKGGCDGKGLLKTHHVSSLSLESNFLRCNSCCVVIISSNES